MNNRIAVSPQVHFGKPCVAGTRIPVQSVLELVREGIPFAERIRDYYPALEPEDSGACGLRACGVVAVQDIRLAPTRSDSGPTRTVRPPRSASSAAWAMTWTR